MNIYLRRQNFQAQYAFPIGKNLSHLDTREHTFDFHKINKKNPNCKVVVEYSTNIDEDVALQLHYNTMVSSETSGIIWAAIVLCGMYILIIFDIYDRTIAALLASSSALAVLAYRHKRPSLDQIMEWIDAETLMLLFCMMILVAIIAETGIFDYCAVLAYKVIFLVIFVCILSIKLFICIVDRR